MTTAPGVIAARIIPRTQIATAGLVVGFALLTAAAAQVTFPLWFTPVPITGQTFVVLLAGATLGVRAGAASQGLYVMLGAIGLPFYAGGEGGWSAATGATGGYLVGFVMAAALVGALAERGHDRNPLTAIPAFLAGTAVIYLVGVAWLARVLQVGATEAMELGMVPFVLGDLVKVALTGLALPAVWRMVGEIPKG